MTEPPDGAAADVLMHIRFYALPDKPLVVRVSAETRERVMAEWARTHSRMNPNSRNANGASPPNDALTFPAISTPPDIIQRDERPIVVMLRLYDVLAMF